jgi:hypothetical protein
MAGCIRNHKRKRARFEIAPGAAQLYRGFRKMNRSLSRRKFIRPALRRWPERQEDVL